MHNSRTLDCRSTVRVINPASEACFISKIHLFSPFCPRLRIAYSAEPRPKITLISKAFTDITM